MYIRVLRSTCTEHRISARSKGVAKILISRILPYFYIISRENGVKMGYGFNKNGV